MSVDPCHGAEHLIQPYLDRALTEVDEKKAADVIAAEDPRARGQTFNVVDGEGERIWSYLGSYLRGSGQRGIRIPIPYRLAWLLVRAAYATIFRRNQKLPHIFVPCRFESRLKPLRYSNRRAREVLGWTPRLDFDACLSRTYGALSAH